MSRKRGVTPPMVTIVSNTKSDYENDDYPNLFSSLWAQKYTKMIFLLFLVPLTSAFEDIDQIQREIAELRNFDLERLDDPKFQACILQNVLENNFEEKLKSSIDFLRIFKSCNQNRARRDLDARDFETVFDWVISFYGENGSLLPQSLGELQTRIDEIVRKALST